MHAIFHLFASPAYRSLRTRERDHVKLCVLEYRIALHLQWPTRHNRADIESIDMLMNFAANANYRMNRISRIK